MISQIFFNLKKKAGFNYRFFFMKIVRNKNGKGKIPPKKKKGERIKKEKEKECNIKLRFLH